MLSTEVLEHKGPESGPHAAYVQQSTHVLLKMSRTVRSLRDLTSNITSVRKIILTAHRQTGFGFLTKSPQQHLKSSKHTTTCNRKQASNHVANLQDTQVRSHVPHAHCIHGRDQSPKPGTFPFFILRTLTFTTQQSYSTGLFSLVTYCKIVLLSWTLSPWQSSQASSSPWPTRSHWPHGRALL